jgi:hypothetical protein
MKCWACSEAIEIHHRVIELPIAGTLVHIGCYERETGTRARLSPTFTEYLRARAERAA